MGEMLVWVAGMARLLQREPWTPRTHPDRVRTSALGWDPGVGEAYFTPAPADPTDARYRAPETSDRWERTVDERSELYSLGVVAYELCCGTPPFVVADPLSLAHAHLAVTPTPLHELTDVPVGVAAIVHRLLAKEPDDRYASPSGLIHDVEQALATLIEIHDVPAFPLGTADVPRVLHPDVAGFGRESERSLLDDALAMARRGAASHVVVVGPQGSAVSAFAEHFVRHARNEGSSVGHGRFDGVRQRPLHGWHEALQRLLACLPWTDAHRARIQDKLGPYVRPLVAWLPGLAAHLHSPTQEGIGPADPDRLLRAVRSLLAVLGELAPGSVLALDRVDAVDPPSAQLLADVRQQRLDGLLVLEVHRADDLPEGLAPRVAQVQMSPFTPEQTLDWVSRTTRSPRGSVTELASALHRCTLGRPGAMREVLLHWADQHQVRWSAEGWTHDPGAFDDEPLHTDVTVLASRRIQRLADPVRSFLVLAARLPHLHPALLGAVTERAEDDLTALVDRSLDEGILFRRSDGALHWAHQRIREELAALAEAKLVHRRVACAWLALGNEELADPVELAAQARAGGLGLDGQPTDEGSGTWSDVYLRGSVACLERLSFAEALAFTHDAERADDDPPSAALLMARARAAFHTGDHALMTEALDQVRSLGDGPLDRVEADLLHFQADLAATRWDEATDRAVKALGSLGVSVPARPGKVQVAAELTQTMAVLKGRSADDLAAAPVTDDPTHRAIDRLLVWCATAAYFAAPDLVPLCGLRMTRLAARRGVTPDTAFGLALMGLVQAGVLERFAEALTWADAADSLMLRLPNPGLHGKVGLLVDGFVRGWAMPLQGRIDAVLVRRRRGWAAGDETFAVYCGATAVYNAFAAGTPLHQLDELLDEVVDHALRSHQVQAWPMFAAWRQLHTSLAAGQSELVGTWFDWRDARPRFEQEGDGNSLGHAGVAAGVLAYATGNFERAAEHLDVAYRALDGILGQCVVAVQRAFSGLSHAALAQQTHGWTRQRHLWRARYDRLRLARLAAGNPTDLKAWLHLLDGELACARGQWLEGLRAMDAAAHWATTHGRHHDVALVALRAAHACERCDLSGMAAGHRQTAEAAWTRYGAPGMARAAAGTPVHDAVDEFDVLRAVQAVAEEQAPHSLSERLLHLILQSTAAERASLFHHLADGWQLAAHAGREDALDERPMVEQVALGGRPMDLAEARRRGFVNDETRSLWVTPIRRAGRIEAVLYLDTRHVDDAFGPAAKRFVEALGTQAAISRAHAATVLEAEASARRALTTHEALRNSHAQLRASTVSLARLDGILAGITDGVVVLDSEGRVSLVNPAAAYWLGADLDPASLDALCTSLDPWVHPPGGDPVPVRTVRAPLVDEDGSEAGEVVLVSDMTARHEAEQAHQQARIAAEEANRAKSQFLANMSHELRTPLTAIIGYADLLREDASGTDDEDLARIQRAGRHLLDLINDVLDLSKVEADSLELHPETVAVADVLEQVHEQAHVLAKARNNSYGSGRVDPELTVRCDRMRTRQILLNLLSNACKFTDEGEVRLAVRTSECTVTISVADTGMGIAPDVVERVFDAFQQAHPKIAQNYGGTGLGLALSRELAERMGGTLTVESELGVGSVFRLTLPRS